MNSKTSGWALTALAGVAAVGGYLWWQSQAAGAVFPGVASGNGRIEAVEIDVAAKAAGRLSEVLVSEGDLVTEGQPLAMIDSRQLQAALHQAQAEKKRAELAVDTAMIVVKQAEAEKRAADAGVEQAIAASAATWKQYERTEALAKSSTASAAALDADRATALSAKAGIAAAEAQQAAAEAAINSAQSAVLNAKAAVEVAQAAIEMIEVQLTDNTLTAPREGRVQYLVARAGEIVASGGRVVNLADLGDVSMSFFLPTAQAGRLAIGDEARIVLDAAPDWVIPAKISYVADVAQFTPKTVETEIEREKLMFRIKARIDPDLLRAHIDRVKTGLPGVAYVRTDPGAAWPAALEVRLPQ
ncbi:MAG: efflux RND transporter periplasmic adaptor subunit [Paracoccaceae bacterium]|nr:efflux RND transporter periplasmic adaptor subunit [Paracoccaceae bacterium]